MEGYIVGWIYDNVSTETPFQYSNKIIHILNSNQILIQLSNPFMLQIFVGKSRYLVIVMHAIHDQAIHDRPCRNQHRLIFASNPRGLNQ